MDFRKLIGAWRRPRTSPRTSPLPPLSDMPRIRLIAEPGGQWGAHDGYYGISRATAAEAADFINERIEDVLAEAGAAGQPRSPGAYDAPD